MHEYTDMDQAVGARSPYRCDYKIGATNDGRFTALELKILNNHVSTLTISSER